MFYRERREEEEGERREESRGEGKEGKGQRRGEGRDREGKGLYSFQKSELLCIKLYNFTENCH